jgi:hypothetical protein
VIRLVGSFELHDFIALLSRSLLSCTHWSGNHTIVNAGRPLFISTSTSIIVESRPFTAIECTIEIIVLKLFNYIHNIYKYILKANKKQKAYMLSVFYEIHNYLATFDSSVYSFMKLLSSGGVLLNSEAPFHTIVHTLI